MREIAVEGFDIECQTWHWTQSAQDSGLRLKGPTGRYATVFLHKDRLVAVKLGCVLFVNRNSSKAADPFLLRYMHEAHPVVYTENRPFQEIIKAVPQYLAMGLEVEDIVGRMKLPA